MSFLQRLVDHFTSFERRLMSDLDKINAKLDALAAAYAAESEKTALLIAGNADLRDRIAHLQTRMNEGSTITSADIDGVLRRIGEITDSVSAMSVKEDVALAPDALTAPADAPVDVGPVTPPPPPPADPAPVAPSLADPAAPTAAAAPEFVPGSATVVTSQPADPAPAQV